MTFPKTKSPQLTMGLKFPSSCFPKALLFILPALTVVANTRPCQNNKWVKVYFAFLDFASTKLEVLSKTFSDLSNLSYITLCNQS